MFTKELMKNKIMSIILMVIGVLSIFIEGDATFTIFSLMIGLPLFFAKKNWIN